MKLNLINLALTLIAYSSLLACTPTVPRSEPTPLNTASSLRRETSPQYPTLDDFWDGHAHFQLSVPATGLPMGESDTIDPPGENLTTASLWSYVHASHPSLGVIDSCGDPVDFPGCVVLFQSEDDGHSFTPHRNTDGQVACMIECTRCPCDSKRDHTDQQQYPQIALLPAQNQNDTPASSLESPLWLMVYEYRANIFLRKSTDGISWGRAEEIPLTGIWQQWLMSCRPEEQIGPHPHASPNYDCLVGSPPGIFVDTSQPIPGLYIFVGLGQNPGAMGCYRGSPYAPAALFRKCNQNPLFVGASDYGPTDAVGPQTNPYFDFRTVSSADVIQVGERYYMLYEGVRGPTPDAAGDTQFALGLARSKTDRIDGPWELYPASPILVDLPGNVGVGHADLIVQDGQTILYTSLDGETRSRLILTWRPGHPQ